MFDSHLNWKGAQRPIVGGKQAERRHQSIEAESLELGILFDLIYTPIVGGKKAVHRGCKRGARHLILFVYLS